MEQVLLRVLFGLSIFAVAVGLGSLLYSWECEMRWGDSGLPYRWGIVSGCLVQVPSGRWLPEDRVRDVDLGSPAASAPAIPR